VTSSFTLRRRLVRAKRADRGVVVSQSDVRELIELRLEVETLKFELARLEAERRKGR